MDSLTELNLLFDRHIPLIKQVTTSKDLLLQKETDLLEWILGRAWLVLPFIHCEKETGPCAQIDLIDRIERIVTGPDSGFQVENRLSLIEDGPRLVRCFSVESWGDKFFEIKDENDISSANAIKSFGLEAITSGLFETLKCGLSLEVESRDLESRIAKINEVLVSITEKFEIECEATEEANHNEAAAFKEATGNDKD